MGSQSNTQQLSKKKELEGKRSSVRLEQQGKERY